MNKKFSTTNILYGITLLTLFFLSASKNFIAHYFNRYENIRQWTNPSLTTFTSETKSEINTTFPLSLWHSEKSVNGTRNDRIEAQRKWVDYLSEIRDNITVKNILVLKSKEKFSYWIQPENEKEMCPSHFEYNIRDKCNFVRKIVDESLTVDVSAYDAVISTAGLYGRYEHNFESNFPQQIYYTRESPYSGTNNALYRVGHESKLILATYSSNADITVTYGKWVQNTHHSKYTQYLPVEKKNYAENKTKLVAMMVSNCNGNNNRLKYALQLRKYVNVDIFGKCSPEKKQCGASCHEMLKTEYKFYLAFENANCRDYITEKFYNNALKNDIIPIVMGAHPEDYKAVAPPHSYIHVEDFPSPSALAKYLKLLNSNNALYNEYFQWKAMGQFVNTWDDFFCRVCAMIIYSGFQPSPKRPMNDSNFHSKSQCLQKKVWYWTREK